MSFANACQLAVLEFSSLPMLGWLAAAVLPWLIHRWHRRQHRTTSWAAVELLLSAMQQRARRVKLQQWLLLAVRTAILVLVTLAVAEPALRQWAIGASGATQVHQVIVLDQSYSMGYRQADSTRWERAKASARRLIEANEDNAVSVIAWGQQPENMLGRPTFDHTFAIASIEELESSDEVTNLDAGVRAIHSAIERAKTEFPRIATHQVVFFTDLCGPTWDVGTQSETLLSELSTVAKVSIVNASEPGELNVAITDLRTEEVATLRQKETNVFATIASFGTQPLSTVSVELLIDGQRIESRPVELRKDGTTTVRFTHQFIDEGPKTVQVALADHGDGLPADDRRWLIVDIQPGLNVACFAGETGVMDDVARALSPNRGVDGTSGEFAPETLSLGRLTDLEISKYSAVLLGGVEQLSPREAQTLTEYVRQGGGLALLLGPSSTQQSLTELQAVLPTGVTGALVEGEFKFDPLEYQHPIVAPFRGQPQAGLLGVAVSKYHRLEETSDDNQAEVILRFDSGDPALIIDQFGLGRVAVSALPCSLSTRSDDGTPWSSFPLSPSFLPVVRELAAYLALDGRQQQRNVLVGEPAEFAMQSQTSGLSLQLPDGSRQKLSSTQPGDHGQVVLRDTSQRGVYRISVDDLEVARFAVNLDPREADIRPIDLATGADSLPGVDKQHLVKGTAAGRDFSFVRTLLGSVIFLLLFEIGLAYMLGRGWG